MIFSRDLLFLHAPKTGGMSITEFLIKVLPRPVFYSHPEHEVGNSKDGVTHLIGIRHENLEQAQEITAQQGFMLESFPIILVVLRNPYAFEVSRYSYLRGGHPWDFGHDQTLALTRDFSTFIKKSDESPDLSRYFFMGRTVPKNLRVIRFESLQHALPAVLEEVGIRSFEQLPHENKSRHGDYRTYYTRETEELVHERHKWMFDLALYDRLTISSKENLVEKDREPALRLPIVGPIRQVAPVSGFWPDLWAGPVIRTSLKALRDIASVELQASLPANGTDSLELTTLVDGDAVGTTVVQPGGQVRWKFPLSASGGSSFDFELRSSRSWSPREDKVHDDRELALQVIRMFFRPAEPR